MLVYGLKTDIYFDCFKYRYLKCSISKSNSWTWDKIYSLLVSSVTLKGEVELELEPRCFVTHRLMNRGWLPVKLLSTSYKLYEAHSCHIATPNYVIGHISLYQIVVVFNLPILLFYPILSHTILTILWASRICLYVAVCLLIDDNSFRDQTFYCRFGSKMF